METRSNQWIHLSHETAQPTIWINKIMKLWSSWFSFSTPIVLLTIASKWPPWASAPIARCWKLQNRNEKFNVISHCVCGVRWHAMGVVIVPLATYPRFGPFGAKIGNTMPTKPQRAVITNTGRAPIASYSTLELDFHSKSLKCTIEVSRKTLLFLLSIIH